MADPREEPTSTHAVSSGAPAGRRAVIYCGGQVTVRALPPRGALVIGRSTSCELQIDDASVSRRHATLHVEGSPRIEDLGSSNGTLLAGKRLPPNAPTPIPPGAVVAIGRATLILVSGADASNEELAAHAPASAREDDATMARLRGLVELVAPTRLTVILLGETGVGKEVMAESIHRGSERASKPLVRVNCAALPENLLETELFGHERGAFTGAAQAKPGLLEVADGGTMLLDEVGELPLTVQAKLLRVLETREVQRVGSVRPKLVDVRFIAATNRDLGAQVQSGTFRADLFYRLDGITITIPPLRERLDELPGLVERFVAGASAAASRPPAAVAPDAMTWLLAQPWPGNVRELRNVVERAVVLARGGELRVEHLRLGAPSIPPRAPQSPQSPSAPSSSSPDLRTELEALERKRIEDALERAHGNQTTAAKLLGISRRTLIGRLDSYALPRPRKRD